MGPNRPTVHPAPRGVNPYLHAHQPGNAAGRHSWLRVFITEIGVSGIGACGIERREGGGIGVGRSGRHIFREFHGGNRIWSGRGGKRLRCGVLRGARLPFALLLRGLDEFSVGADFEVGILQGGEGEARVAKFWKTSHIFLLAQSSTRETKKQLYGSIVERQS